MDERRFDWFTRRLGAAEDRRSVFRIVAGGLLGAPFGASALEASAGNGSKQCGIMTCQPGWACCHFKTGAGCYPRQFVRCCNQGLCSKDTDCCGSAQCCQKGWKCCGHGVCCPKGWRCGKYACEAKSAGASPAATVPFAPAQPSDTREWIERGWLALAPENAPTRSAR